MRRTYFLTALMQSHHAARAFREKTTVMRASAVSARSSHGTNAPLWAALSTPVYDPSRPRDYALLNCSSSPSRPLLTFARLLVPSPLADHCLGDSRASGEARVDALGTTLEATEGQLGTNMTQTRN